MTIKLGSLSAERIRLLTHHLTNAVLDFLFPPRCIGCGCVGSLFCSHCQERLIAPPPLRVPPLAEHRATAEYQGPMRTILLNLKFKRQWHIADLLGERLYREFCRTDWQPTLITAVPMRNTRLHVRGFNQAALLASALARRADLPFSPSALRRIRETGTQVGRAAHERKANVAGAFAAESRWVKGQAIIVVDDIYTTGATLAECARALLNEGATCVWGLTVARATLAS